MNIVENREVSYTLILNKKEAYWLKNWMQNSILKETEEESQIRRTFWDVLPPLQELS